MLNHKDAIRNAIDKVGVSMVNKNKFIENTEYKIDILDVAEDNSLNAWIQSYLKMYLIPTLSDTAFFFPESKNSVNLESSKEIDGEYLKSRFSYCIENGTLHVTVRVEVHNDDLIKVYNLVITYNIITCMERNNMFSLDAKMYKVRIVYNDRSIEHFTVTTYEYEQFGIRLKVNSNHERFIPFNNVFSISESFID